MNLDAHKALIAFAIVAALILPASTLAQEESESEKPEPGAMTNGLSVSAGYHFYLRSNYLKEVERVFDPKELDGPVFKAAYFCRCLEWVGFELGFLYYRADPTFKEPGGELRVHFETMGLAPSVIFFGKLGNRFYPYVGIGPTMVLLRTSIELDAVGGNTTAGSDETFGFGFHASIGMDVHLLSWLHVFVEDQHAYVPMLHYGGSDETFDAGGNMITGGFRFTF